MTAVRAGVPVPARDTGAAGYVYPGDDPGAWHATTGVLGDGAWLWLTATVVIIARVIHRPLGGQDGNPAASPQPEGHPDLRIHDAWPREDGDGLGGRAGDPRLRATLRELAAG